MITDNRSVRTRLCNAIRSQQSDALSEVYDRERMSAYQRLFFNNFDHFVQSAFPVLRTLFDDRRWLELIRLFMAEHRCDSPIFRDIPEEFLVFLVSHHSSYAPEYPFLTELAHYEWMELVIDTRPASDGFSVLPETVGGTGFRMADRAELLQYQYPVHLIDAQLAQQGIAVQPSWLVISRNRESGVFFSELSEHSAWLLHQFGGPELLSPEQLCQNHNIRGEATITAIHQQIRDWTESGILVTSETLNPTERN